MKIQLQTMLFIFALIFLVIQNGAAISEKIKPLSRDKPSQEAELFLDLVPFSAEPKGKEFRIGFREGDDFYFLELQPEREDICTEKNQLMEDVIKNILLPPKLDSSVVILFPFSKATKLKKIEILNPHKWTVIDMNSRAKELSFTQLSAIFGDFHDLGVNSGCWYVGSKSVVKRNQPYIPINYPINDNNLFFAIPRKLPKIPKVGLPISAIPKYTVDRLAGSSKSLPRGYMDLINLPEIKVVLGKEYKKLKETTRQIYGHSIKAAVDRKTKDAEVLWLINWYFNREEDEGEGNTLWGIFKEGKKYLRPLFISKLGTLEEYDSYYEGRFVAAVDLDGDEIDELIIGAKYYEGKNYKVFALRDGKYVEVYNSFYFGL